MRADDGGKCYGCIGVKWFVVGIDLQKEQYVIAERKDGSRKKLLVTCIVGRTHDGSDVAMFMDTTDSYRRGWGMIPSDEDHWDDHDGPGEEWGSNYW